MARIRYRGAFATFPIVGMNPGDLALATDLNLLFEWNGVAWFPYHDYPDYEGGKSRLLTTAEWAAFEGEDVNFYVSSAPLAHEAFVVLNYVVPAGRTLYITQASFRIYADLAANADNNQIGWMYIYNVATLTVLGIVGGNGGGQVPLTKPIVIQGGQTVRFYGVCGANHDCHIALTAFGYLV